LEKEERIKVEKPGGKWGEMVRALKDD
jgi:hypothetical protein